MFLAIVSRIKDHSGYHCIYRSLRISAKTALRKNFCKFSNCDKNVVLERLEKISCSDFLQYTMDTVICQGTLDISLLKWSAAEWNQAENLKIGDITSQFLYQLFIALG